MEKVGLLVVSWFDENMYYAINPEHKEVAIANALLKIDAVLDEESAKYFADELVVSRVIYNNGINYVGISSEIESLEYYTLEVL